MDIVKQTNPNECGVCVICSFIKHFYHHFDKLNVLDHANLTSDGLSVFDLEVLGQKYGLFLETYQLD
jgi:ABC-type bacteriocin/lantibiotic exporter with double-glycine peptidase domain